MAVIDSSAVIPLARSGNLPLLYDLFDSVFTVEEVKEETLVEGKRGSSVIKQAFDELIEFDEPVNYSDIARLEGLAGTDAKVLALGEEKGDILIANDRAMVKAARSRGNTAIWPTTLVLKAVKQDIMSEEEGKQAVRDMVSEGMNLSPKVYDMIVREIEDIT